MQVLVLLLFVVLTCVFTWPQVTHLGTHLPGAFRDNRHRLWRYWWFHEALTRGTNPHFSTMVSYPTGQNFLGWEAFPVDLTVIFLLQYVVNAPAAMNAYALAMFVLSGYAAYRLGRAVGLHTPAAVVAGVIYAFNPSISGVLQQGSLPYLATGWLPLAVLALWRLGEPTSEVFRDFGSLSMLQRLREFKKTPEVNQPRGWRLRWVLAAAGVIVIHGSSGGYHVITAGYTAAVVGVAVLVGAARRRRVRATLGRLVLVGALTAAGMVLVNLPRMVEVSRFEPTETGPGMDFAGDLVRFVVPRTGEMREGPGPADTAYLPTYLCWSVLLVAVASVVRGRRWRDLTWWALLVVGLVMTLGPALKIGGQYEFGQGANRHMIWLPLSWVMEHVPGFFFVYNSTRLVYGAILALAILAGLAVDRLTGAGHCVPRPDLPGRAGSGMGSASAKTAARRSVVIAAAVGAAVFAEAIVGSPVPFPRINMPVERPEFYRRLSEEPDQFALFEAPTRRSAEHVLGAIVHRRPVANLIHDRGTRNYLAHTFRERDPLARYLQRLKTKTPDGDVYASFPDPVDLGPWRQLRIKYIVFHRGHYHPDEFADPAAGDAEVEGHLRDLFGEPVASWRTDWDEAVVFRIYDRPPPAPAEEVATALMIADWCVEGREYELAVRFIERAIEVSPAPDAALHLQLARVAYLARRPALARQQAERALDIDPSRDDARRFLRKTLSLLEPAGP